MSELRMLVLAVAVAAAAAGSARGAAALPLRDHGSVSGTETPRRALWRRFAAPYPGAGGGASVDVGEGPGLGERRPRRSADRLERCERLRLCRLHAGAAHSLLAAYQLYFVNRETARLWDHAPRSRADCERRFSCDR